MFKDEDGNKPLHIIPQITATRWRLITIFKEDVVLGSWTTCGSYQEAERECIQYLSRYGEEVMKVFTDSSTRLEEIGDIIGTRLEPVKLSDLMYGNTIKDSKFSKFVSDWVENYLPYAELNTARPEFECELWKLIPLDKYKVEEIEALDEDGDVCDYWVIKDGDRIVMPEEEDGYNEGERRAPHNCKIELTYKDEPGWGYSLKREAEAMALYLNTIATGVDEDYPEDIEHGHFKHINSCVPKELLQRYGVTLYEYWGPETGGYQYKYTLADFSDWASSRETTYAKVCAEYHYKNGYTVKTAIGSRNIDPFN